ncbi:MAG: response regulator [Mariprofundales bacterium]
MTAVNMRLHATLLLLFTVVLVVILLQVERFDHQESFRAHQVFSQIEQLDAQSEQEMLMIYSRGVFNYDALTDQAKQLDAARKRVNAIMGGVKGGESHLIDDSLQSLNASVTQQLKGIEDFKRGHGILAKAQYDLPTLAAQLVIEQPQYAGMIWHWVSLWMQPRLMLDAVSERLTQQGLAQADSLGLEPLVHAGRLIDNYSMRSREAILLAANCGMPENLVQVRAIFDRHFAAGMERNRIHKLALLLFSVTVFVYLMVLLLLLRRNALQMRDEAAYRSTLEEGNRLLVAAMAMAPNGILVCNREGKVFYANARLAQIHGADDSEHLIGRFAAELRGGERGDALYQEMVATTDRDQLWSGEYRVTAEDGEQRTIARTMSGITLDGRRYLVGIDRDVTEERQAMAKLEQGQRLESLGVLAGGVAHDFNNILASIQGNADLARRKVLPAHAAISTYLERICDASSRAAMLCRQMLSYAGKEQFVLKPFHLSALVMSMGQLLEVSISKRVRLTYDLTSDLPLVEADETQIQQVILNFITNANEAMLELEPSRTGEIVLRTGEVEMDAAALGICVMAQGTEPGCFVFVEAEDNGCGMDSETMARIFEPFFTTKFTGRGLGMSAVLGIVRAHHAALQVESEPDQGSRFRMLLPCVGEALPMPSSLPAVSAIETPLSGKVLVIDDEEIIREVVIDVLEEIGIEVVVAAGGEAGVALFRDQAESIDMVLLDMTMPGMDGVTCFRHLQEIQPNVRVVVVSGYSEQDVLTEFGQDQLAGFVHKPFDPQQLQRLLKQAISE